MLKSPVWLCALLLTFVSPAVSAAFSDNVLHRISIKQHSTYTRITFSLDRGADFSLSEMSGNRLKVIFPGTITLQSAKLRKYSDSRIGGISFPRHPDRAAVVVAMKGATSYRMNPPIRSGLIILDIGPSPWREPAHPQREKIWSGTEKLIRDFEPPLRPDVPFIPSDTKLLRRMMAEPDLKEFLRGEAALYKGNASEAEEIFRPFLGREGPVRAVAFYRFGEAMYLAHKFPAALAAFREGEKLDPEYITRNPSAIYFYADSLVRGGNFEAGRKLLLKLINGLAWTEHGPSMLVRLGDMYAKAGQDKAALAIYRNVVSCFPRSRGFQSASIRLNDLEFFKVNGVTCRGLISRYRKSNLSSSDPVMQEEALFKAVLLESLYGPVQDAVAAVTEYGKRYPFGIFTSVARNIREELLLELFRDLDKRGDCAGLLGLVANHRNYLARCLADDRFLKAVSDCFVRKGMIREELKLFMELVDSEWATQSAPFIYSRILEDALTLEDEVIAEGAGREFLSRYPRHPLAWGIIARLGELFYRKGEMHEAASLLARLEGKGSVVEEPESFYYLGKAREKIRDGAGTEKAMVRFLDELRRRGTESPFVPDAYMVRGLSRLARQDAKGAMAMFMVGYESAHGEMRDAFLFKMGDVSRRSGDLNQARANWEKLVREGNDPVWKSMASHELADLE